MSANTDLKDWGPKLRMSLARATHGKSLYEAYGVAYELSLPAWETLTYLTKEDWCAKAQRGIEAVKPQPRGLPPIRFTGLRGTHPGIIGAIAPAEGE